MLGVKRGLSQLTICFWVLFVASWLLYRWPEWQNLRRRGFHVQKLRALPHKYDARNGSQSLNRLNIWLSNEFTDGVDARFQLGERQEKETQSVAPRLQSNMVAKIEVPDSNKSAVSEYWDNRNVDYGFNITCGAEGSSDCPLTERNDPGEDTQKMDEEIDGSEIKSQESSSWWQRSYEPATGFDDRSHGVEQADLDQKDDTEVVKDSEIEDYKSALIRPQNNVKQVENSDNQSRIKGFSSNKDQAIQTIKCVTVQEMGAAAVGDIRESSLQVRRMIQNYIAEHGAEHVRTLPAEQFCRRGFVYGRATEDGFGNDMYKILTAAGLGIMLNRSLIIGEHGSTNRAYVGLTGHIRLPFGDYIKYSNQTFTVSEIKLLWVKHDCVKTFKRPLVIRVDDFQKPTRTRVLCEDWTKWKDSIIWFKGTTDSTALQFFLKNRHPIMQSSATLLLGDPSQPNSRGNLFGELFHTFISPMPVVEDAVKWALRGVSKPDVSLHLRMLNNRSKRTLDAACSCIFRALKKHLHQKKQPLVVVVSDTPAVIEGIERRLKGFAKVLHFDYKMFLRLAQNTSKVMSATSFRPPLKRTRDWGSMPRWVALVDFFLASRAKYAVVSAANRRVGTTYAQLLAAFAAASNEHNKHHSDFEFLSSFQSPLLAAGLSGQRGWGHAWRRFGGPLSCHNQRNQCAETPLLPYAWWEGPWQSPVPGDIRRMLSYGMQVTETGEAVRGSLERSCEARKVPVEVMRLEMARHGRA